MEDGGTMETESGGVRIREDSKSAKVAAEDESSTVSGGKEDVENESAEDAKEELDKKAKVENKEVKKKAMSMKTLGKKEHPGKI